MTRKTKAQRAASLAEQRRQQEIQLEQRRKLVDEYGRLDSELLHVKPKLRRQEDLGRLVRSWFVAEDPEQTYTAAGQEFEVVVGPAGMQTHLADMSELYRVMGHDAFVKGASMTLKSLEAHLDGATVASLTRKERTGTRSLLVRERVA